MNFTGIIRNALSAAAALLIVCIFSGCGGADASSILVMGSTALQPLVEQGSKQFADKYPDFSVQVQGGGSGTGLTAVSSGAAQIGNSDIFAEEKKGIDYTALQDHKVCVMGIAVVANEDVNVDSLTDADLKGIFEGSITNWSDLGGNDMPTVVINRPPSSGTGASFREYALDGAEVVSGKTLTEDSSGAVLRTVADTAGAVSYVGLPYIINAAGIKTIAIDGTEPTAENITAGRYRVWAYEHMYTKGNAEGVAKLLIDYMMSGEFTPTVKKLGYVPISEMRVSR